jgi:hypothetical protein
MEMKSYYHGTGADALAQIAAVGLRPGTYVTETFQTAALYALSHRHEGGALILKVRACVSIPEQQAYPDERIIVGAARVIGVYAPNFEDDSLPEDWMEPNEDITDFKYPGLYNPINWLIRAED